MADTFSPYLGLLLQATGSHTNDWINQFNNNDLLPLEKAIAGITPTIPASSGNDFIFDTTNYWNKALVDIADAPGATGGSIPFLLFMPTSVANTPRWWLFNNRCVTPGLIVTFGQASGLPTVVPAGLHIVYADLNNAVIVQ